MAEEEVVVAEGPSEVEEPPSPEPEPQPEPDPSRFTPEQEQRVMAMIQERDRQWEARNAAEAVAKPAPAPAPAPDVDAEIAALYSDDENGKRTRETIERHLNLKMQAMGIDPSASLTREEVQQIAAQQSGLVREQIRSGLTITQEVQDLVARNVIGDDDAAVVQKAYSQTIASPAMKNAADNPANAPWILKGVVYDLIKSGKVKPDLQRRNTNPLTPAGPAPEAKPAPIDPSTSPFPSIKKTSKEALEAARATSLRNFKGANGG